MDIFFGGKGASIEEEKKSAGGQSHVHKKASRHTLNDRIHERPLISEQTKHGLDGRHRHRYTKQYPDKVFPESVITGLGSADEETKIEEE